MNLLSCSAARDDFSNLPQTICQRDNEAFVSNIWWE